MKAGRHGSAQRSIVAGAALLLAASACSAAPDADPPATSHHLTWTRTTSPCDAEDIGDLVATDAGFALTCPYGEVTMWTSSDGISWTTASPPPTDGNEFAVRAVPAGIFAHNATGAWFSADAAAWDEVDLGAAPLDDSIVAAGGAGALIIDTSSRRAWLSIDGAEFHAVGNVPQLDGTSAVLATDEGFIIGALYVDPIPGAEWSTVLWVSEDGRDWRRTDSALLDGTIRFGSADAQVSLREFEDGVGVASSRGSHLLLNRRFGFGATPAYNRPRAWADAIWYSDDGREWTDISSNPDLDGGRFRQIDGGDLGWLLIGQNWGAPVWWFSPDGEHWEQAPQEVSNLGVESGDLTVPPNRMISAVGGSAVVVGVDPFDGPPLLWVGSATPGT